MVLDRRQRTEWGMFWLWALVIGLVAFFLSVLVALPGLAQAATSVTLEWQHPTTDPLELGDITGYRVRWRVDGQTVYTVLDVGKVTTYRLTGLPDNVKLWYSAQAVDFLGQESGWSAEVYSPAPPKTMGGLKVLRLELQR